jgi:hypothetical protein
MRVRTDCTPAEQNLIAIQYKGDVYYKSIRDIRAGDELTGLLRKEFDEFF